MDIHKPKPWHGLREFLKEYVIIVVGVLTALAAEQAVEWVRWREQVDQSLGYVQSELQISLREAYERAIGQDCFAARLKGLRDGLQATGPQWKAVPADIVRTHGKYWDTAVFPVVYATPYRPYPSTAWDSALANNSVAHMSKGEAARYASLYRMVQHLYYLQEQEKALVPLVRPLGYDLQLGPDEKFRLLQTLAQLDDLNLSISAMSGQFLDKASRGPTEDWLTADVAAEVRAEFPACPLHATPYLKLRAR